MFRRTVEIVYSSLRMALQELWKNKLRTFLSLFGITIGIFCIIGVLATLGSLEYNIQKEIKSFGTNTIYIDKWEYANMGGPDAPWWKYVKRPSPKYEQLHQIMDRTSSAKYAAFKIHRQTDVVYEDYTLANVVIYGFSDDFNKIQTIDISYGRYISSSEFQHGSNAAVIGNEVAEELFVEAQRAVGKLIDVRGKKCIVVGVIKKQGNNMIGGWQFDKCVITPYRFARFIMDERRADPLILVQGQDKVTSIELKDDLKGAMRAINRLSPTQDDNFSLNDVNEWSKAFEQAFSGIKLGGAIIGGISLIVGLFGVANIMFVSVKERTNHIGLKKAIGAKSRIILVEFLLEAAFLCLIGGLIGLLMVFGLTTIMTSKFNFPIFISTSNLVWAIGICFIVGILAGIIPASMAARMNPVVAIRSK
jgi:putative ABC transport system permease protein